MAVEQWSITGILITVLCLFIWGRWRYDVVALMALFASTLLGIVPNDQLFSGFGHPATIMVAIVLILSYGLTKSGAIEGVVKLVSPLSAIPSLHITALLFIAAFFSMFMNNVGALALLMPIAIQSTVKAGRSPSTVLMPLSFGSILGGLVTLIGTPPNIIIATYRQQTFGEPFHMFDFAPVGGAIALAGILFMSIVGWRLVKVRKTNAGSSLFEIESYLFEVKVPKDSDLKGKSTRELEGMLVDYDITLAALIHKKQYHPVPAKRHLLATNDVLVLEGGQEEIDKLVSKYGLALLGADSTRQAISHSENTVMMEVVLAPGSPLEEKVMEQIRFKANYGVNLLAVSREGKALRGRLKQLQLKVGDVLLLHGEQEHVEELVGKLGCFPLAERGVNFGKRKYAMPALGIFAVSIVLSASGILPIQTSLGIAAVLMVLLNIVPVRELYNGIDLPVIVLLGAMIPVGGALESTGTTKIIADGLLNMAGDMPIIVILTAILVITMTLSDILNNAATAILMAPIGKTIAESAGVSPDPFLIAVAVGASCAFLTPIGHQNNALVMGPGAYRFGDYWRVGLPLEVIIVAVAIPLILIVWPL